MWIREGECPPERCGGRCCEVIGHWIPATESDYLEFLQVRGYQIADVEGSDLVLAVLPQPCPFLTGGLCALHPSIRKPNMPIRPALCDDWPVEPAQMLLHRDYCGFTFRWVDEENV